MPITETKEIAIIRSEAGGLVDTAQELVIFDEEDAKGANELLVFVASAKKKLEDQRVFLVKPLNDHVKDINGAFKEWVRPLDTADIVVRRKMLEFQQKLYQEAEALRAEAQRLEDERQALGEELLDLLPVVTAPVAPRLIKGASGSTSVRKTWTFEVTDDTLVPREYLVVDEGVISLAVRKGTRDIPGVRIFQQESLAVRSR